MPTTLFYLLFVIPFLKQGNNSTTGLKLNWLLRFVLTLLWFDGGVNPFSFSGINFGHAYVTGEWSHWVKLLQLVSKVEIWKLIVIKDQLISKDVTLEVKCLLPSKEPSSGADTGIYRQSRGEFGSVWGFKLFRMVQVTLSKPEWCECASCTVWKSEGVSFHTCPRSVNKRWE